MMARGFREQSAIHTLSRMAEWKINLALTLCPQHIDGHGSP